MCICDRYFVQVSDVDGALVRTFLSPAHRRAATLVCFLDPCTSACHVCSRQQVPQAAPATATDMMAACAILTGNTSGC